MGNVLKTRDGISIHAPRVGSDHSMTTKNNKITISIHAPRVGSDQCKRQLSYDSTHFNPRSPCGERQTFNKKRQIRPRFQSTLPVWGATSKSGSTTRTTVISIHAPRVGSDVPYTHTGLKRGLFQSTLPVWGATCKFAQKIFTRKNFNPRSPCGERLTGRRCAYIYAADFNPRSPCGERLLPDPCLPQTI